MSLPASSVGCPNDSNHSDRAPTLAVYMPAAPTLQRILAVPHKSPADGAGSSGPMRPQSLRVRAGAAV